jgi:hypothetical protein
MFRKTLPTRADMDCGSPATRPQVWDRLGLLSCLTVAFGNEAAARTIRWDEGPLPMDRARGCQLHVRTAAKLRAVRAPGVHGDVYLIGYFV